MYLYCRFSRLPAALCPKKMRQQIYKHNDCWWKKSGGHQLRLVVYPIVYKVSYIPAGAGSPWINSTMSTLPKTQAPKPFSYPSISKSIEGTTEPTTKSYGRWHEIAQEEPFTYKQMVMILGTTESKTGSKQQARLYHFIKDKI